MEIRRATPDDAAGMGRVLREIVARTGKERPTDVAFVTSRYLADPTSIRCTVAIADDGEVVGFQSLKVAGPGNPYDTPDGWGIIGTHISPRAHRQGVGTKLFAASKRAAFDAGLEKIDAYIAADNPMGLRYYDAMGFRTYREPDGIVQKVLVLAA
ncbi:MAG: GNAT family N-acetyltransferase [Sphingomonas sp.]|uniref:GNAT family N-acetyltransferase n=1 Tax=Sphingomonas sp. TaxID=28214 RepID=UPI001AC05F08|nr:GNAT family N-acetyltransferase [Sphingomonas sp.]MBN8808607.1 GNAT family N-acetyltransferase [Sphingomonas sp.]